MRSSRFCLAAVTRDPRRRDVRQGVRRERPHRLAIRQLARVVRERRSIGPPALEDRDERSLGERDRHGDEREPLFAHLDGVHEVMVGLLEVPGQHHGDTEEQGRGGLPRAVRLEGLGR